MWRAFREVMRDLAEFAFGSSTPAAAATASVSLKKDTDEGTKTTQMISTYQDHLRQAAARVAPAAEVPLPAVLTEPTEPPAPARTRSEAETAATPAFAYVAHNDVPCYQRPVRALDTVIGRVPYGTKVLVVRYQGRWAQIERQGEFGWVEKDSLRDEAEAVFPVLEPGLVYEPRHPVTKRLRLLLQDEFAAKDLLLPLLDIEYVTYRLFKAGRVIAWPPQRPRLADRWSKLLRGVKGVHIGIRPTTDAVMEWADKDGVGHVAYVEAVHPDEGIDIAGIYSPVDGRFDRATLSRKQWLELGPTFIEIK